jgi:MYXO-CTERM domain-containing protein
MRAPSCRLAVAAALAALTSCAVDGAGSPAPAPGEPAAPALRQVRSPVDYATIPDEPFTTVCNGGRLHCYALVRSTETGGFKIFAGGGGGLGATDLQSAYAIDTSNQTAATIAIVDAYDYPNVESDLAKYRSQYGLPACTKASGCLEVVNQNGQTSPLPSTAPRNDDWTVEAALDLDMASAACPKCKLLFVEAQDDQGDGLFIANNGAATAGAAVVSNSWGGPDDGSSPSYETYFNHPGVSFFVATGDNGYNQTPDYPSTSAYVIGVGGTSLQQSSGSRGWSESAWRAGGSSCSTTIPKPSYQGNTSCSHRAASDVAAVGDPNTGVVVYNADSGGFLVIGGTSAASPLVAGIYAATGHGADGPSFAYGHTGMYWDVTSGSNGSCGAPLCQAGTGWDGPTGVGTPNAAMLQTAVANQAPTVTITAPGDGATVAPGFAVSVDASDDQAVAKVELRVDGTLVGTKTAAPYTFQTDPNLVDGDHSLEATAYDGPGLTGTDTATVTVSVAGGPDGGVDPGGPDGGSTVGGDGGGSGNGEGGYTAAGCCEVGGGDTGAGGWLLALGVSAVLVRRRRRAR